MNDLFYFAIDHGNFAVKSSILEKYVSGYTECKSGESLTNSNLLVYQGKYYTIGENRINFKFNKCETNDFYILTLPMIANKLKKEGVNEADMILGVGLPLSAFSLKEEFKKYFIGQVNFQFEGIEYSCNIKEVYVFPQCYSAFLNDINAYANIGELVVIDIGGMTTDVICVSYGRLLTNKTLCLNNGVITLYKDIQQQLIKKNIKIEESQIIDVIKGEMPIFFNKEIGEIILRQTNDYVGRLIAEIREHQIADLSINPCIICGGGAVLLEKYFTNNKDISICAVMDEFANCKGFEMLAKQTYEKGR